MSKYLKYTKQGDNGCLEWTRCLNTDGYPRAGVKGNSNLKVHREVFKDIHGYYPEVVRHTCDNPICINPEHLLGGTAQDNLMDRIIRGRCRNHKPKELLSQVKELMKLDFKRAQISQILNIGLREAEYLMAKVRKAG